MSTWRGPEPYSEEVYPPTLLCTLLKQMMAQFAAQGAAIALLDDRLGQMRIQIHVRAKNVYVPTSSNTESGGIRGITRRVTAHLENSMSSSGLLRNIPAIPALEEIEEVTLQQSEFLAIGSTYPIGQDLVGYTWQKQDAIAMSHEDYITFLHGGVPLPYHVDIAPSSYLLVPLHEAVLNDEVSGPKSQPMPHRILGVIVLYRIQPGAGFQPKQCSEALQYVERVALYLQNNKLQRSQKRTMSYLHLLQDISIAFPTSVKLSDLVDNIYRFTAQVVDVSSMLLTLYDRDTEGIYDVLAVSNGVRVEHLAEQPGVKSKDQALLWWQTTLQEKRSLLFSPLHEPQMANAYSELLTGIWGDQRQSESFLLLPMKMFNRVTGSLRITSRRPNAYIREEIQVLETMLQIVTVSIENAKLYERDRRLLREAKQREGQLAAINSALQTMGSELQLRELLNSFVKTVATLVDIEMCVFFQVMPDQDDLIAQAMYGPSTFSMFDDGSGTPPVTEPTNQAAHDLLINTIRLPFKDTILEQLINGGFFYLDPPELEELAQKCDGGGFIFLRETHIQHMLMIPMFFQGRFIGILSVPTIKEHRRFRPKDVGTLLALCAQAASAIRNAQLFADREVAYAELERMDKLKDEFLVTASHELRTPLSAISGYASLLKRQSSRTSPQQILRFATKISTAAQQLTDLVGTMTEATKIGTIDRKLELQIGPVQVLSAAEIAVNMITVNIEQTITSDIDPNLWMDADAAHVRQVLTNLLENAAKYSPPDTEIRLSATPMTLAEVTEYLSEDQVDHTLLLDQRDLPVVLIRVHDQGEGIIPDDQKRIFEKFVRAPRSLTTPVRGSGLGLYISRRYIEAMGGRLWLESSIANEGSLFSFFLPRVESPVEQ